MFKNHHQSLQNNTPIRVGIDIGGTFTDFVVYDPVSGIIDSFKMLSNPANPADPVFQGLKRIFPGDEHEVRPAQIIHGSTVATNALL